MRKIHGMVGIALMGLPQVLAGVILLKKSIPLFILFLAIAAVSVVGLLHSYCAKCGCRETGCGHLFVGPLSAKLFPKTIPAPYTVVDYLISLGPVLLLVILPQPFLSTMQLLAYWGITALGAIDIGFFVCKGCGDRQCLLHRS